VSVWTLSRGDQIIGGDSRRDERGTSAHPLSSAVSPAPLSPPSIIGRKCGCDRRCEAIVGGRILAAAAENCGYVRESAARLAAENS